jgi:hypothetical protein
VSPEEIVMRLVQIALDLVTPEVLHGKIDEAAQIRAARDAADAGAAAKFGQAPWARCRSPSTTSNDTYPTLSIASSNRIGDTPMTWSFSQRPDESVLARWHRLFDELLANGAIDKSSPGDILAAFLNVSGRAGDPVALIGGKPTNDVHLWTTNCAMTQHAAMVHCGHEMRPMVNAEPIQGGINSYLELARGDTRWVENDGIARPMGPCIFYVLPSARLPYEHVGAFGVELARNVDYVTYEGGGGDGTRIAKSERTLSQPDSYGRHIGGWWEIGDLLPESPVSTGAGDKTYARAPTDEGEAAGGGETS